jgi:dTDP-4-amino-4,6-dideoxygalactose transaminase
MNLLLDVNIIVDVCVERPLFGKASRDAVNLALAGGFGVWIYAGSVQTLEYTLISELKRICADDELCLTNRQISFRARALLKDFCADKNWLAALSAEGHVFEAQDPEDEQLIRALDRLIPGEIALLTRDEQLLNRQHPRILSPEQYLTRRPEAKPIDFIDLKGQQNDIRPALETGIHRVLHHGQYIMGPEVKELEAKLGAYVGAKHAIGCASGTDALLMALMAYGVGPGDAIFTTPFTFIATAEVISLLGATPVFVDIDPATFNIDPAKLALAIQAVKANDHSRHPLPKAKANILSPRAGEGQGKGVGLRPYGIIPVDLFGLPADYDAINAIAKDHGLFVIEDAAQSFGAEYKGKKACSLADIACTSFFPAKPLGCYGDGGMCFTDDDQLAKILESIRVHGKGSDKYDNIRIGINGRLDTLQAAILLSKFAIFPDEVTLRQEVANRYTALLAPHSLLLTTHVAEGYTSVWAQYSILARDGDHRTALQKRLQENKIPTAIYYPKPLHMQTAFAFLGYAPGAFPVSEDAANRIFSLPMHPYLTIADQERIISALADI